MNEAETSGRRCSFCGLWITVIPGTGEQGVPPKWAFDECQRCRDRFATAGLAASMNHFGNDPVKWAQNAYRIADAMLEARKPK